jgi:autotransporter-associated beta strand protein
MIMRASQTLGILILAGALIVSVPEFAKGQDVEINRELGGSGMHSTRITHPTHLVHNHGRGGRHKPEPTPAPSTGVDAQIAWKNTAAGQKDFNTGSNWIGTPGTVPGVNDVAAFSGTQVAQPNLSAIVTIGGLYFTSTASGYDITSSNTSVKFTLTGTSTSTGVLAESSPSTANAIRGDNTSGTNTVDAPIVLGGASNTTQAFVQAAGGTLVINGVISNTNNITLSLAGGGTFTLAGANTYTGGTTLSAGILQLGSNGVVSAGGTITSGPVGTGLLTLSSGTTLRSDSSTNRTIQNSLSLSGSITLGATSTQTGTVTFNSTDGTHTLSTAATVTLTGDTTLTTLSSVNIADVISGSFNLTKAGASTLTLSGANTYSGTTTVNAGTLKIDNNGSTTSGRIGSTATITVNSGGTLLLSGSGSADRINNSAGITLAGGTLAKGSGVNEGSTSAVGMGALTLTANSTLDYTGTSGTLTFASFSPSTFKLSIVNYFGNGSFGGTDQLIFNQDESTRLGSFDFGFGAGVDVAEHSLGGGFFEVYSTVPVPEPGTWCAAALAFGVIGYSQRRRFGRLLKLA